MNEISKRFEQFLIDENCFSQFCNNLIELSQDSFNEFVERYKPENYIMLAFVWDRDKYGIVWSNLHIKWNDILDEYEEC